MLLLTVTYSTTFVPEVDLIMESQPQTIQCPLPSSKKISKSLVKTSVNPVSVNFFFFTLPIHHRASLNVSGKQKFHSLNKALLSPRF